MPEPDIIHSPKRLIDEEKAPSRWLAVFIVISVIVWTVQSAFFKSILPLDSLETVCWGARLEWGYFKHPPLSAWMGFLFARLTNYSDWSQYFLVQACIGIGVWYVYKTARLFFNENKSVISALLLYCLHYYTPSDMVFCPNPVQVLFQPIMAYYFLLAVRENRLVHWLLTGLFCALAFLGKYSAGLPMAGMAAGLIFFKPARKRLCGIGPYLALITFLAGISGHIIWLFEHDFICLTYVGNSLNAAPFANAIIMPLYIFITALYPIAVQFTVLTAGCLPKDFHKVAMRRNHEAIYWSAMLCCLPAIIIVILSAVCQSVVSMWLSTMASWSGLLVVSAFPWEITRKSRIILSWLVILFTAGFFIGTTLDLMLRPRQRLHLNQKALVAAVSSATKLRPFVIAGERWLANAVEYYHPQHPQSIDIQDPIMMERLKNAKGKTTIVLVALDESQLVELYRFLEVENLPINTISIPVATSCHKHTQTNTTFFLAILN